MIDTERYIFLILKLTLKFLQCILPCVVIFLYFSRIPNEHFLNVLWIKKCLVLGFNLQLQPAQKIIFYYLRNYRCGFFYNEPTISQRVLNLPTVREIKTLLKKGRADFCWRKSIVPVNLLRVHHCLYKKVFLHAIFFHRFVWFMNLSVFLSSITSCSSKFHNLAILCKKHCTLIFSRSACQEVHLTSLCTSSKPFMILLTSNEFHDSIFFCLCRVCLHKNYSITFIILFTVFSLP